MPNFENRQKPKDLSLDQLEDVFTVIVDYFKIKWLKTPGSNPLQKLWNRKDILATCELFSFGLALKSLSEVDKNWTKQQVSQIKSDHLNNRLGSLFEINGLGLFFGDKHTIAPTRGNNPGFDGVLTTVIGKTMRLSLKNYGDSAHQREFNSYAAKFENKLKNELKRVNLQSVHILIDSQKAFPQKEDWEKLNNQIATILEEAKNGLPKFAIIDNFWAVSCCLLTYDSHPFHPNHNSYTLIISSPFHKNEEKNLLDKLDDACANLIKHSNTEDSNIINTVFVHLPESASIVQCREWAQQYFDDFPEKPITGIILYQPSIAKDQANNSGILHHCFQMVFRNERLANWSMDDISITLRLPVGISSGVPAQNKIIFEVDGKIESIDIKSRYIYQRGNLYIDKKTTADNSMHWEMKHLASGIITHAVIQPFPDQASLVLAPHVAPEDKLLVL